MPVRAACRSRSNSTATTANRWTVFLLLAPEHASGDHLKALARISRLVREPAMLERLRAAEDATALKAVLLAPVTSHAA